MVRDNQSRRTRATWIARITNKRSVGLLGLARARSGSLGLVGKALECAVLTP
jgi:hypothetical protein